jgi:hypothetical protein
MTRRGEPIAWLIGIARRCTGAVSNPQRASSVEDRAAPGELATRRSALARRAAVSRLSERDRS